MKEASVELEAAEINSERGWLRFNGNKMLKRSSEQQVNRAHALWAVSIHHKRLTFLEVTPT